MTNKTNKKEIANKSNQSIPAPYQLKPFALNTHDEVPTPPAMSRRTVLKASAAWMTMASALLACERVPPRKVVSRPSLPEYQKPGKELYYATTWTEGNYPYGMLVKTVDGRPIKVDGNPEHPINKGVATTQMQASTIGLYDPDRLRHPLKNEEKADWKEVDLEIISKLKEAKSVVLLTRATLGPAEQKLVNVFLEACPQATHFTHEAIHNEERQQAWSEMFGERGELLPDLSQTKVVLSLESDLLGTDGVHLKNARDFAQKRKLRDDQPKEMSRLYVAEAGMSITGSNADHRMRMRPSQMLKLAQTILNALKGNKTALAQAAKELGVKQQLLELLVEDLQNHPGEAVVVAGSHLPPAVHAAVALVNDQLKAWNKTLKWEKRNTLPVSDPQKVEETLDKGVDVLISLGVNPMYDWYGDFKPYFEKAKTTVSHGLYLDETLSQSTYALASHHNLESWNDAQPTDGVYSICQPTVRPLHQTRQEAESLLVWTKGLEPKNKVDFRHDVDQEGLWYAFIRYHVNSQRSDRQWVKLVQQGLEGEATTQSTPTLQKEKAQKMISDLPKAGEFELQLNPHPLVFDGRFAPNPWLHEIPDPVTKLVWDNAAMMSRSTAKKLGVEEGSLVKVTVGEKELTLPVLVQKGVADQVIVTTLGYGRDKAGTFGSEQGFNTYQLRSRKQAVSPWLFFGVQVSAVSGSYKLVRTQKEFGMHERDIALDGKLEQWQKNPEHFQEIRKKHMMPNSQLHEEYDYSPDATPYKWGMAIDLNACIGCNACMVACQAENNTPFVGKEECSLGREMHWIRVDRYEEGDPDNPTIHQQPMLCQHCDNAPCESVCPVEATVHTDDGLNAMAYNRCVGTRYCANNCPYKVRRFNFYDYRDLRDPVQELAMNPQVTVRSRGVMEKCTFCIQRINHARIEARNAGEVLPDGAVQTACQQGCPTQAIHFGNLNDFNSQVKQLSQSSRAFFVLEEINTRPNVAYLGKVRNQSNKV